MPKSITRGAICDECAKENGWQWPEGHIATFSMCKCDQCGQEKSCCETSDWKRK